MKGKSSIILPFGPLSKTVDKRAITSNRKTGEFSIGQNGAFRESVSVLVSNPLLPQRKIRVEPRLSDKAATFNPKLVASVSPTKKHASGLSSKSSSVSKAHSIHLQNSSSILRTAKETDFFFNEPQGTIQKENKPSENSKRSSSFIQPISSNDASSKSETERKRVQNSSSMIEPHATQASGSLAMVRIPKSLMNAESEGENGKVKAYGASTDKGKVRGYNEDRVSIVIGISKPPEHPNAQDLKCSLFAVFDGHGGPKCADFLRDNFYKALIRGSSFPSNPKEALASACQEIEKSFLEICEKSFGNFTEKVERSVSSRSQVKNVENETAQSFTSASQFHRSGSCANIVLVLGTLHVEDAN